MLEKGGNASSEEVDQDSISLQKPIMVYDGNCSFCRFWVSKWQNLASEEVDFVPYQQLPKLYYGVTRQQFSRSVYLVTKYRRLHGAAAVFEVLAIGGDDSWNRIYYNVVLADTFFEAAYRVVANNRDFFFWLTKLFYTDARAFK
ncbi:thiol-disulfide oxidoreductase DCC family protein [Pontibacter sp. H249]|uniref:thiol-disulfide oxidoreductase DCC family protein n=1 Tax=Pontibacter sp. H249 TaxID=3133420 RepID=UPI0030BDAC6D